MNDFILILDDDPDLVKEWKKQADQLPEWCERTLIVCYGRDGIDLIDLLQRQGREITAVFLDFDLLDPSDKPFGAEKFMEAAKDYIDWNQTRCFWFSGDEGLEQASIEQVKPRFKALDSSHLRKPLSFKQLIAKLTVTDFKLGEQWLNFPWPLRVIDQQANPVANNRYWRIALNEPAAELFVKEGKFDLDDKEFYGHHPYGNVGDDPNKPLMHFRLVSFLDSSERYLLQFAESLVGSEKAKERNQLAELIKKIKIALQGHGFKRIRLYRYYAVPRIYDQTNGESNQVKGFMSLYYSNTRLNDGIEPGIRKEERGICDCCVVPDRAEWIKQKIENNKDELVHRIDDSKALAACDKNTVPEDARNSQCVLELPLISFDDEIYRITHENLLGLLVVDKYDDIEKNYVQITNEDVKRLQHTLMGYCKELTESLVQEIRDEDVAEKLKYAYSDKDFLNKLDSAASHDLLKKLLESAIEASRASVGYIVLPYQSNSYKIKVTSDHTLFQGCVISANAVDLPVIRCWQTHESIALPDLKQEESIKRAILDAYHDEKMVWRCESHDRDPASVSIESYLAYKIASLIAMPVMAGGEQIAAIILHSDKPYHFDYRKINCLNYLVARVGLILIVSRRLEQRRTFLDGVVHEIKSDIAPLKHAIDELKVDPQQSGIQLRAQYCVTRLEMASKNLLLTIRGIEPDFQSVSSLSKVLPKLLELYQSDMTDRQLTLKFQPVINDAIWQTPLAMGVEWLTHILANLLDNAVKYSKRAEINIFADLNDRYLSLTVCNPGLMSKDELAKVFDANYQSKQGTGFHVGLASCKRVMDAHRGKIDLKNEDGLIKVTVSWPLVHRSGVTHV